MNVNPNAAESRSHMQKIAAYLKGGGKLTALDALRKWKCWSLRSRISDLKKEGMPIQKEMILLKSNKRVAQYYLKAA